MSSPSLGPAPISAPSPPSTNPTLASHPNNKPCTICSTPRPVLVRCQIDESGKWNFVCPGKCWKSVSGGVEDAKGVEGDFPWYRYGGMWKNKHAYVSAKKKTPKKLAPSSSAALVASMDDTSSTDPNGRSDGDEPTDHASSDSSAILQARAAQSDDPDASSSPAEWLPHIHYSRSTLVTHSGNTYVCRREHTSRPLGGKEGSGPAEKKGYRYWKVDDEVMRGLTAEESE